MPCTESLSENLQNKIVLLVQKATQTIKASLMLAPPILINSGGLSKPSTTDDMRVLMLSPHRVPQIEHCSHPGN